MPLPDHNQPTRQQSLALGMEGEAVEGLFSVTHVTYANADTGYAVVQLIPADAGDDAPPLVAVGTLGEPQIGACYRIQGTWHHDPRYGPQVRVSFALPAIPTSLQAVERYLAGASIKGLGAHYAHLIVKHFGQDVIRELDQGGQRLEEVSGIGPVRAAKIRESWGEHQGIHELMVNLQGVAGLTPRQAQQIYREFGREAWQAVSANPYLLAERVRGFGFKTCDRIGRALGVSERAPQRLQAGLLHVLGEALGEGHLWTGADDLLAQAAEILDVPNDLLPSQLAELISQQRVVERKTEGRSGIFLAAAAQTEDRIARRLAQWLAAAPVEALSLSAHDAMQQIEHVGQASLTSEQQRAIVGLLGGQRLVVLTGGPGTGKTTTMRSLIHCLEALDVSYALCATTGRASKQLAATTGRVAATVHRHMGIGFDQESQQVEPVRQTVLIIDEASMIDLWLMDQIVERLTPQTHLFLVGDIDQLPPVGPGAILQDLIAASEERAVAGIEIVRLKQIFRQEAGDQSLIVINCHRIRQGERPLTPTGETSDYYEMTRATPQEARDLVVALAAERLPRYLGIPPEEVQILSPMHGGEAGVQALNAALQARLNPPSARKAELAWGRAGEGRVLREGDKVRQTRNDYQKQIFNGDLGIISRIDREEQLIQVRFDEITASYALAELDDLVHAWAMTVHAAQGSQWPAVVVLMLTNHYVMLERNILYTALSRGQRMAVLIAQDRAVRIAVQRSRSTTRRTALAARLAELNSGVREFRF